MFGTFLEDILWKWFRRLSPEDMGDVILFFQVRISLSIFKQEVVNISSSRLTCLVHKRMFTKAKSCNFKGAKSRTSPLIPKQNLPSTWSISEALKNMHMYMYNILYIYISVCVYCSWFVYTPDLLHKIVQVSNYPVGFVNLVCVWPWSLR